MGDKNKVSKQILILTLEKCINVCKYTKPNGVFLAHKMYAIRQRIGREKIFHMNLLFI